MNILALSGTYKTSINSEGSMNLEVGSERKLNHPKDSLPLEEYSNILFYILWYKIFHMIAIFGIL